MTTNRRPLLRLFLVLLLNITAFAISIPVLPALAEHLGGSPVDVGMLYATQALGQFLMAPGWGALSDNFGRKRILMATFAAAAVLELTTAFVPSLLLLYLVRFLVGLCAGNVATATALIADSTDSANRSRGMAVVGISFGLGFTLGPAIGAGVSLLTKPGLALRVAELPLGGAPAALINAIAPLGTGLPFAFSSAMSLVTLVLAAFLLVEPEQDAEQRRKSRARAKDPNSELHTRSVGEQLRQRPVFLMSALFFLYTVSITVMEGTFFVYMAEVYDYDVARVGLLFAAMGIWMALFQGAVGPTARALGDRKMTGLGAILLAAGLVFASISGTNLWLLLVFLSIATIGRAFIHPGVLSLISTLATHRQETGRIMGISQSASSLGRIVGPALGGLLFLYISPTAPFWFAGLLMAVSGLWWWIATRNLFSHTVGEPQAAE